MIAILLFLFAAAGLDAQLPGTFVLRNLPASITGTFVPGTETTLPQTFDVRVRNRAPLLPGTYFVTFSPGQSGDFNARLAVGGSGQFLNYQIYDTYPGGSVLKDLTGSPTSSEVISGSYVTSNGNQIFNHSFTVVIPENQLPGAGTYTDTLIMTLYKGTVDTYETGPTYSIPISFTVSIPTVLKLSLVPAGNPFDEFSVSLNLNFGTLFSGNVYVQTADLIVQGNTGYNVDVTSQNGGVLKHLTLTDTVPYAFTVDGASVPLPAGTPTPIAAAEPIPPAEGEIYELSFQIDTIGTAATGDYSDNLSFTLTAN